MKQHPQLSVVDDQSVESVDTTVSTTKPLVHCTAILPPRNPNLSEIIGLCPPIHRLAKSINEENVKPFFSTPVLYSPQEMPIAFICFKKAMTADEVVKFRTRVPFYPILFDLFLTAFATDIDFFRGKKVVDIDTVIPSKNGGQMIPYIDGTSLDHDQKIGYDLMVEKYNCVWDADTWFAFCNAIPPRHPSARVKNPPMIVEVDDN